MNKPDLIFSCGRLCLQENPTVDIAKELFQGRYRLEEEIGRGNNAVTFKGKDKFLDIDRAIRIGVCSKEEERLQKKFLEESKKNARKQSALIPVLFYSDFNFDKWVIQAAVMDYSDDELLSKWLELRKKRLENKDSESIFQIESDSIAIAISYVSELYKMACASFVHGDAHAGNVFVPIKSELSQRVESRFDVMELPGLLFPDELEVKFECQLCNVKFIDAGSSFLVKEDNEISIESVKREIRKIKETVVMLMEAANMPFQLKEKQLNFILPFFKNLENMNIDEIRLNREKAKPVDLLKVFELSMILILKAIQTVHFNNYGREAQYTILEDIAEIQGLILQVRIGHAEDINDRRKRSVTSKKLFDFDLFFNRLLAGKLFHKSGFPYIFSGSHLKVRMPKY